MKNTSSMMLGIVEGIFTDILSYLPDLARETKQCFIVLQRAVSDRGLPFLTITLPECAKFLESSLEEGCIPTERPPYHGRYSNSDCRPVFLHGLWSRIFDSQGLPLDDPDGFSISALRQVYLTCKKWKMECHQEYRDSAVRDYLSIEASLPRPRPGTWDSDVPSWSRLTGHPLWGEQKAKSSRQMTLSGLEQPEVLFDSSVWALFRELCSRLSASFGLVDTWAIRPKHGPGAVSDQSKNHIKYDFQNWPRKLDAVFPFDYFASSDFVDRRETDKEYPCKLIAVPKTQKGPRLIASEPIAHQWIQGGLQRWFEDVIAQSPLGLSIDFSDQKASQALALEASETGAMATVDLSSASDRLTARLVDYVFQANHSLLDALHACRSRSVRIPKQIHPDKHEEILSLRKYAAQGSALTFPVQTVIFTMIGHLALMLQDGSRDCSLRALRSRAHRIRVFGDDIIIDIGAYEHLVALLTECGLKVNESKSFAKGNFREACGMDAYSGVDVTPAYLRTSYDPSIPETLVSVIETANNFYKRGWWHASNALLKTVDSEILMKIPVTNMGLGSVSLFTYQDGFFTSTRRRWNKLLHRYEYLGLALTQQSTKQEGTGAASIFQYFTEDPSQSKLWSENEPLSDWSVGQSKRPRLRIKPRWESQT